MRAITFGLIALAVLTVVLHQSVTVFFEAVMVGAAGVAVFFMVGAWHLKQVEKRHDQFMRQKFPPKPISS